MVDTKNVPSQYDHQKVCCLLHSWLTLENLASDKHKSLINLVYDDLFRVCIQRSVVNICYFKNFEFSKLKLKRYKPLDFDYITEDLQEALVHVDLEIFPLTAIDYGHSSIFTSVSGVHKCHCEEIPPFVPKSSERAELNG
ncbi:hypothetical protein PHYBLDRAFT_167240 [Phycomyces blakesleeanus NRRL 1555(-)]|uniref:Uncharacterized protein n=1 Tax=Phycomyces blakesleeanus (strain ATCC 8743b / DSM 1359 / FGSC 10004 / NBRC 33097 / NRRL 1555) TaxID=763407 RepID=A0A162XHC3_PHYB8|nr:hypothetical protein PHYBLDRAFT_167240 [Phycomyces blakesleeanus NRRL 1555(-)]OAD74905.1 hypothetical protein PHYBLDRAFT_167240 [Phycomyces blakesleeanus NRRL 1555(-)]|eukprot:XP_018292945.1 hypothetical protein PHYBLDRAFT_167240 [Phycomyces blakesleeanus NRRL 1555(-)]